MILVARPFKAHPDLNGVDTEAAEQVFHIASRWQTNLSNSHSVHFELQLLLFCHEHNERNKCEAAFQNYTMQQQVRVQPVKVTSEVAGLCDDSRVKRRRFISTGCGRDAAGSSSSSSSSGPPVNTGETIQERTSEMIANVNFLGSEFVFVNERSRTVHVVMFHTKGVVQVKCSYIPPWGSKPLHIDKLAGSDLFTCGVCCGLRCRLHLE